MKKQISFLGFDDCHRVVNYKVIPADYFSVQTAAQIMSVMIGEVENLRRIYAIDSKLGWDWRFEKSKIARSLSRDLEFENLIRANGIRMY